MTYQVTPQDIRKLRELTGDGILVCKSALTYTQGDMADAQLFLSRQGTSRKSPELVAKYGEFPTRPVTRIVILGDI